MQPEQHISAHIATIEKIAVGALSNRVRAFIVSFELPNTTRLP